MAGGGTPSPLGEGWGTLAAKAPTLTLPQRGRGKKYRFSCEREGKSEHAGRSLPPPLGEGWGGGTLATKAPTLRSPKGRGKKSILSRPGKSPSPQGREKSEHPRQAGFEVLRRQALETRSGKALQTANHEGREHRGLHLGIHAGRGRARRLRRRSRRLCLSVASILSKNWFMRCCRRSFSNTSASPTITRVMPGFFSANCSSMATTLAAC